MSDPINVKVDVELNEGARRLLQHQERLAAFRTATVALLVLAYAIWAHVAGWL